eukprot:1013138-Prymnesium_polylepis.2
MATRQWQHGADGNTAVATRQWQHGSGKHPLILRPRQACVGKSEEAVCLLFLHSLSSCNCAMRTHLAVQWQAPRQSRQESRQERRQALEVARLEHIAHGIVHGIAHGAAWRAPHGIVRRAARGTVPSSALRYSPKEVDAACRPLHLSFQRLRAQTAQIRSVSHTIRLVIVRSPSALDALRQHCSVVGPGHTGRAADTGRIAETPCPCRPPQHVPIIVLADK